jgi:hypothetical protein
VLAKDQRNGITVEREIKERILSEQVEQRKNMDRDHVSLNRKVLAEKKKDLQLIQTKN